MTERQGSATPAPAGGRPQDWLPRRAERIGEVPATLAHDIIDAALAVLTADNSHGGVTDVAAALDRLADLVERGVSDGVLRWVEDPTL